ncbi:MAG: LptF/LptG family permease [bacterium]|nr:LptF/LptG family permease [bacterium]
MKKHITIYDKYIFKQVLFATTVAILLFIIVWIAPEMLLKVIKGVLSGDITPYTGMLILVYEIPKILGKAFPVGLLLGSLFTFDKLSKDSELTIFRAVGMSFGRIIRPVIVLSLIITIFCFITYDKLIPHSCQKLLEIKERNPVTQFIYTQKDENNNPLESVIVSKFMNNKMNGIIIMNFNDQIFSDLHGLEQLYIAKSGVMGKTPDGKSCWKLYDITSYNINSDGIFNEIRKISHKDILIGDVAENAYTLMVNSTKKEREITNKNLKSYVKLLKKESLDDEYRLFLNKYLQRYLHPLVCILLALLGCILGFSKPREQRLIGFTIAIGFIFVYYITLPFFDLLAEKGVLHPIITASFPPLAFLAATMMFYKSRDI